MPREMNLAVLDAIERDQAARTVDPTTLIEPEKDIKIRALQARIAEFEGIATYLANLLQAVEQATLTAPPDDRAFRRLIVELTNRRWRCSTPVMVVESAPSIIVEGETGSESFMRRAL